MGTNFRKFFPIYTTKDIGVFLDSAATTHMPQCVIDRMNYFYAHENAPAHRSLYQRGEQVTVLYEQARATVAQFLGAEPAEIIFTAGATAGINAIATRWGSHVVSTGDTIIVSQMEHHSNFLPWQRLAHERNARLCIVPVTSDGQLDLDAYQKLLSAKTKIVAMTHVSNVLGTTNNIAHIKIGRAHV